MKLLIVGMLNSVHLARWTSQIAGQGWEIQLFPSNDVTFIHPMIARLPVKVHPISVLDAAIDSVKYRLIRLPLVLVRVLVRTLAIRVDQAARLKRVVRKFRPDIIHSIETQSAGYLVESVRDDLVRTGDFPRWLHTNWGSDIFLYGRLSKHVNRVRAVLAACDYYSCEADRDVTLARQFGFRGKVLGCYPNAGGFDIESIKALSHASRPSQRKIILLKGYQGWAGRALVGLKALEMAGSSLSGLKILVYGNVSGTDIDVASELLSIKTGVPVEVLPYIADHHHMLEHFASARLYIGLSISDSISTSLLEAMAMGAFPIQSDTSTANEWIVDGESGAIVPPEDPYQIAHRISVALTDDALVDAAAERNWKVICSRADGKVLQLKSVELYATMMRDDVVKRIP